jgi:hypothetical protein
MIRALLMGSFWWQGYVSLGIQFRRVIAANQYLFARQRLFAA